MKYLIIFQVEFTVKDGAPITVCGDGNYLLQFGEYLPILLFLLLLFLILYIQYMVNIMISLTYLLLMAFRHLQIHVNIYVFKKYIHMLSTFYLLLFFKSDLFNGDFVDRGSFSAEVHIQIFESPYMYYR